MVQAREAPCRVVTLAARRRFEFEKILIRQKVVAAHEAIPRLPELVDHLLARNFHLRRRTHRRVFLEVHHRHASAGVAFNGLVFPPANNDIDAYGVIPNYLLAVGTWYQSHDVSLRFIFLARLCVNAGLILTHLARREEGCPPRQSVREHC